MSDTDSMPSLRARIAAHSSWAQTSDRTARTAPARAKFEQRFLDMADGDPVKAASFRAAHFARMALRSARARRQTRDADEVESVGDVVA